MLKKCRLNDKINFGFNAASIQTFMQRASFKVVFSPSNLLFMSPKSSKLVVDLDTTLDFKGRLNNTNATNISTY